MEKWVPKFKKQRKTNSFSQKRAYERRHKDISDIKFMELEEKKKILAD